MNKGSRKTILLGPMLGAVIGLAADRAVASSPDVGGATDPRRAAQEFKAAYPIRAALTSVSDVWVCASGARILVAGDHYGRVLVGLPADGNTVSWEWRATDVTRIHDDLWIVPFYPVSGPHPDALRIVGWRESDACGAAETGTHDAVSATDAATWPGARVLFERFGARLAFRPIPNESAKARAAYVVETPDDGPRMVLCRPADCLDRPMFADVRQTQIRLIDDVGEDAGPTQTAWRVASVTLDDRRMSVRLETTFDRSALEQIIPIARTCATNPSRRDVAFCPMR